MKTEIEALKEKQIYGNRAIVYLNIDTKTPTAIALWLVFATAEFDGKTVYLEDWKADFEAGTIYARGSIYTGNGSYRKFNETFRCVKEELPCHKPGRNFVWGDFFGEWRNSKTGEKRRAFVAAPAKTPCNLL